MPNSRRDFIKALGIGALATTAFTAVPTTFTAHAADTSGYKALVCVFLFGGLDCHDLILPYDLPSYDQYARLRSPLLAQQGTARQRSSLLPLTPASDTVLQGRQVALPPEMPQLASLFRQNKAAIVGNVGPLVEPVTRANFESAAVRLPPRLFSHNDQQAVWQANQPEGAQYGWGGLFADAVLASGANAALPQFSTITTEDVGPFLTGRNAVPYRVSTAGSARVDFLEDYYEGVSGDRADLLRAVRDQMAARSYRGSHLLERDMAAAFSGGFETNEAYDIARQQGVSLPTSFPATPLGAQLRAVAETIGVRDRLLSSRQVFFVGLGGFDTHDAQARALPKLLSQIDGALGAFQTAMEALGLTRDVTLFTASDFGRTLAVNGDGTDHGWGGHQIVLGGAVKGGEIYGTLPPPVLGHDADSGGGRLIPSVAVDSYAAELGRWFGLSESELSSALPGLENFEPLPNRFI